RGPAHARPHAASMHGVRGRDKPQPTLRAIASDAPWQDSWDLCRWRAIRQRVGGISWRRIAMRRRELLKALGLLAASPLPLSCASSAAGKALAGTGSGPPARRRVHLRRPAKGPIPVAFLLSDGAVMIDFAGPWEVFQDVYVPSRGATMEEQMPFRLYTVAETTKPITASGGMKIVPDYDLASAPAPKIIVVPAQGATSEAVLEWMRTS